MAIKAKIRTQFGEDRECYIRLNNIEASNHGMPTRALFRGFLSRDSFEDGAHFVWEESVEFTADMARPLWPQAYEALAAQAGVPVAEV